MMKTKKLLCLVLAVVFVFSIALMGCGDSNTDVDTPDTTPTTAPDNSGTDGDDSGLEPVALTMYVVGNGEENDTDDVEDKIAEILKDDLNITLDYHVLGWGEYTPTMEMKAAAREEYDLAFTSNWAFHTDTNAAKGAFTPLNDGRELMRTYAPKAIEVMGEDFWAAGRINGFNYAAPCYKEVSHAYGVMFPTEFIDKYDFNLDEINSLADLEPWFATIKENEPGVYPLQSLLGESALKLLDWDQVDNNDRVPGALSMDPTDGDYTVFNEWETQEFYDFCALLYDFAQKGYIKEDAINDTDYNVDLKAKQMFCTVKSLKPGKDGEFATNYGYDWVQKILTPNVMSNREATGAMMAVSSTSKNPERAVMFLEKLYTDKDVINTMFWGIEGVHYEKISDNVIKITEKGQADYNGGNNWRYGNQYINYTLESEDPDKYDNFLKFTQEAIPAKSLGFMFDNEPVLSEVSACEQVYSQYWPALCTGAEDPAVLIPAFLSDLKDAGVDKVIAEKQAQLDAWLASK